MSDQSCNLGLAPVVPLPVRSWTGSYSFYCLGYEPKAVVWVDWNNVCENSLKSIKHCTHLKLHCVIVIIIVVVFWAGENDFHFLCFALSLTKNPTRELSHSLLYKVLLGSEGVSSGACSWSTSQKSSTSRWVEPLGHGEKEIHKCYVDVWASVVFFLSNLALSLLVFQRDFTPLVVCALPTLMLESKKDAKLI